MARPPDADSAETHDRIVGAALSLLQEQGAATQLSMRQIAGRAQVSTGTIQYYFETKEELLEACLDSYHARIAALLGEFSQRLAAAESGEALIEWGARRVYRFVHEERHLVELRLVTNLRRGELHPRRQPEVLGALVGHAADTLKPFVHADPIEIRLAIQALAAMYVRFARFSPGELAALTGIDSDEASEVSESYFARAAALLLRPRSTRE